MPTDKQGIPHDGMSPKPGNFFKLCNSVLTLTSLISEDEKIS